MLLGKQMRTSFFRSVNKAHANFFLIRRKHSLSTVVIATCIVCQHMKTWERWNCSNFHEKKVDNVFYIIENVLFLCRDEISFTRSKDVNKVGVFFWLMRTFFFLGYIVWKHIKWSIWFQSEFYRKIDSRFKTEMRILASIENIIEAISRFLLYCRYLDYNSNHYHLAVQVLRVFAGIYAYLWAFAATRRYLRYCRYRKCFSGSRTYCALLESFILWLMIILIVQMNFEWVMKVLTVIMITEMVKPVVKVIIRMSVKRMVSLKVGLTF